MCISSSREKHFQADKGFSTNCSSFSPSPLLSMEACCAPLAPVSCSQLVPQWAFYSATRTTAFFFSPLLLIVHKSLLMMTNHLATTWLLTCLIFWELVEKPPLFSVGWGALSSMTGDNRLFLAGKYFKLLDHMMLVAQLLPCKHRRKLLGKQMGMAVCKWNFTKLTLSWIWPPGHSLPLPVLCCQMFSWPKDTFNLFFFKRRFSVEMPLSTMGL